MFYRLFGVLFLSYKKISLYADCNINKIYYFEMKVTSDFQSNLPNTDEKEKDHSLPVGPNKFCVILMTHKWFER